MTNEIRELLTDLRALLKKHDAEISTDTLCPIKITIGSLECIEVGSWDRLHEDYLTKLLAL